MARFLSTKAILYAEFRLSKGFDRKIRELKKLSVIQLRPKIGADAMRPIKSFIILLLQAWMNKNDLGIETMSDLLKK